MRISLRRLLLAAVLLGAAALGGVVWFVRSGLYDISAIEQHTRIVYRLLDYAMRRSVQARIEDLQVPALQEPDRIRRGAGHYRAHCIQCHGAPGVPPEPFAFGLMPAPANLVGTARHWRDAEMFWVIRNGIKMSGMPAWVGRLDDGQIWDIVAFVRASVQMTPQQYAQLAASLPPPVPGPALTAAASGAPQPVTDAAAPAGDARVGRRLTEGNLCVTCHVIPGIVGADRHVGPPLSGIGSRAYIAGLVPNTPANMVRFLRNPQALDPLSAMPPMGLSEREARDIAAFLATLQDTSR